MANNATVQLGFAHRDLLNYIVKYRKLNDSGANNKELTEQLIVAYAKQILAAMPDPAWRSNMLTLINACEPEHK